jgi:hypothetical protein
VTNCCRDAASGKRGANVVPLKCGALTAPGELRQKLKEGATMNVMKSRRLMFGAIISVLTAVACTKNEDPELTARVQYKVNEVSTTNSDIIVSASDRVVTLTGMTTDTARHAQAVAAARATPGVREVIDHISTPAVLTGATVPK